jgi:GT2 family glycosyltransferase
MSSLPPLGVIFLTYARTNYAIRTLKGMQKHLRYDGDIKLAVVDDGSSDEEHFRQACIHASFVGDLIFSRTTKVGYGANANAAWWAFNNIAPVTLWMEDDWVLQRKLDVTPYVQMLMERDDVGMVRLGHMPIDLNLRSVGYNGRMYLDVKKDEQYAFSGNPHLKHVRVRDSWGIYPIGRNPGETEISYDYQVRAKGGEAIWWPLAIGDDPPFGHIGEVQSYES